MEAATTAGSEQAPRALSGEKAQRIVEAMRASVAVRGAAGSTFDHVAREAGVSRGLLHYYFGTKERLLVEVVRRDCDLRMSLLDRALADAGSADDIIEALVRSLEDIVEHDPGFMVLLFELFTLSRRNDEIAAELAELGRRTREHVGGVLAEKERDGVLVLGAAPQDVAAVLFALGDGLVLRLMSEPGQDFTGALTAAVACGRRLLVAE